MGRTHDVRICSRCFIGHCAGFARMMLFRRKLVRVHQIEVKDERPVPDIDGVLVGKPWRCGGHYVVRKAELVQTENSNIPLGEVWIPRERVVLIEVLSR